MDTIFDILFHELILFMWGLWGLSAVIFGWLIAGSFDEPEETAAAAGLFATISGAFSASAGEGFFSGFHGALSNLVVGVIWVPGWPAMYILPVGWCMGDAMGLEWWQTLLFSLGCALFSAIGMGFAWLAGLALFRNAVPHFVAAIAVIPFFGVSPLIAIAAHAGLSCGG